MATAEQIDTMARHYLIAAIWADCPEGTHPRATKSAAVKARADCAAFVDACGALFDQAMLCPGYGAHPDAGSPAAAFGHDFWLTRNGYGVGFWDRSELGDLGDKISALCGWRTAFPEANYEFYRGWLYLR